MEVVARHYRASRGKSHWEAIQRANLAVVNDAINIVLVEHLCFLALRDSVQRFDNVTHERGLALLLMKHGMVEFHSIGRYLLRRHNNGATQTLFLDKCMDVADTAHVWWNKFKLGMS